MAAHDGLHAPADLRTDLEPTLAACVSRLQTSTPDWRRAAFCAVQSPIGFSIYAYGAQLAVRKTYYGSGADRAQLPVSADPSWQQGTWSRLSFGG